MLFTLAAAPAYAHAPASEQGDIASAVAAAKKSGQRVKIADATTETSEYYANPDGKITGVISAGQARFRRDGSWVPVDLTLQRQADGSVAPKAHPNSLRLSGARAGAAADLASMGTGQNQVAMGWQGALPEPRLEGNKATYADVRPGIDVVVQATVTGFEQFTVVKSATAAKYVSEINLPLSGAGVASVAEDARGRVRVHGADGKQRAEIPTPMMWDARTNKRGVPNRRQVTTDVVTAATPAANARTAGSPATTLSLKPDQKWLTSSDTVYPVTIDPYVDWSTTAASTTVVEGYPTDWPDADSLFVGSWDGVTRTRSYITWWANRLQGMHIDAATAYFANPYSNSCTPTPFELWSTNAFTDDTSWTNQPTWQYKETTAAAETARYDSEHHVSFCDDSWITADATSFFQRAASNNVATPTMGLRAVNETDASQYKQFWSHNYSDASKFPYVEVTYSQPTTPTPDAFNQLLALNPDLTAAELEASMREAATMTGNTYNQVVMKALVEAQNQAGTATASSATTSGKVSALGSTNPTCTKRDLGTSRFRGDIFWSAASTYGVAHGHMGIFYQKNVVVEARGKGQLSGDFNVTGRQYCKNIEKMDVDTSITTQNKAADYAYNSLRSKKYNSNFAWNKGGDISSLNCSELVYKAYKRSVNIDLDGDGGIGVYPNDIRKSKLTRTYQTIT
ncbi:hypothetical protein [Actinoplanes sp. G11-F43]|uniref:hypothetical protein n=1 Tax=Actinoplanes sp. G11-F43 TaxID=3424130 RepID=UPI003D34D320